MSRRPPSIDSVTIGVVTALHHELQAAKHVLGCHHEAEISSGRRGFRNVYLGQVQNKRGNSHGVVLDVLPAIGNEQAALTAQALVHSCCNLNYILMVGIAGGVPDSDNKESVALGDVVVSGAYGVISYAYGKLTDGTFDYRPLPRAPSADLLDAVKKLQADEENPRNNWRELIAEAVRSLGPEWKRPDAGRPRLVVGKIGSANMVLSDKERRDELCKRFGLCAVEMEGSGIAEAAWRDNVGYLIIRGTSDLAATPKKDVWQKYAALVAACFAKRLLQELPVVTLCQQVERRTFGFGQLASSFMTRLGFGRGSSVAERPRQTIHRIDLEGATTTGEDLPDNQTATETPRIECEDTTTREYIQFLLNDLEKRLDNGQLEDAQANHLERFLKQPKGLDQELLAEGCFVMARVEIYRMNKLKEKGLEPDSGPAKEWIQRGKDAAKEGA